MREFRKAADFVRLETLPDDVNAEAESVAKRYLNDDLLIRIRKATKERAYRKVNALNKKGQLVATFHFQNGVCLRCVQILRPSPSVLEEDSVLFYKG